MPVVIEHEAIDDELPKGLRGPDAELGRLGTVHPVANGDDGVEVVEADFARDLASSLRLNYPDFPDSCRLCLQVVGQAPAELPDGAGADLAARRGRDGWWTGEIQKVARRRDVPYP